jgi:hypothetical protein
MNPSVTIGFAFIVDLKSPVVHEPRPGSFHDPAFGRSDEGVRVDAVDDGGGDVAGVVRDVGGDHDHGDQQSDPAHGTVLA